MAALFIVNPLSERVARKGSVLSPLGATLGINTHIIEHFDFMDEVVKRAAQDGIDHVFIEGGDGTAQGVLSAFLNQKDSFDAFPAFTLLPGGMTNQISKNIGLKRTDARTLQNCLARERNTAQPTPMLAVKSGNYPTSFGFLFSTGAIPMVTHYTKDNLHNKGIGGSFAVLGGILRGISGRSADVMHPTDIQMRVHGTEDANISEPHLGTVITTLPSLILSLDPFWGDGPSPLRVTYVRGKYKGLYRHVLGLWMGFKKGHHAKDGLLSWNADRIEYVYSGPIVLDGEFLDFGDEPFCVTATQAVDFIY